MDDTLNFLNKIAGEQKKDSFDYKDIVIEEKKRDEDSINYDTSFVNEGKTKSSPMAFLAQNIVGEIHQLDEIERKQSTKDDYEKLLKEIVVLKKQLNEIQKLLKNKTILNESDEDPEVIIFKIGKHTFKGKMQLVS
jgi:hypothetical protein